MIVLLICLFYEIQQGEFSFIRFLCKKGFMKVAVITDDALKAEWLAQGVQDAMTVEWR